MARNEQLIRQHRMLQILEAARYGKTLGELRDNIVEELGLDSVSERTIRRDLEALQAAGFDIDVHSSERGSIWKFGPRLQRLPEIAASVTELLALSMGRDLLTPLTGTPFWQGIETLWNKFRAGLPEAVWKHFEEQRQGLVVRGSPTKSYAEKKGVLATLNRAILQHRVVEIEYQSASSPTAKAREIEPYSLVLYRGSLYVIAAAVEDADDQPPRHWKLDRFQKATTLDRRFKPREDFDPQAHFAGCLGVYRAGEPIDARIRVAAEAARWVAENPWHPDQQLEWLPGGGVVLTLPNTYALEILPRVLALADAAEVLEPADLRRSVQETLQAMATLYNAPT